MLQVTEQTVNAEKTFDQPNWEFLYGILQNFGFYPTFVKTIQALFNSLRIRIKRHIKLKTGRKEDRVTRQGCPGSPLLFAMFIESLSHGLTQDNNFTGIKMLLGHEYKMSSLRELRVTFSFPCHGEYYFEIIVN